MDRKPSSMDRVLASAAALGLPISLRTMPQSTRTAEEAAAACGTTVSQIIKSLVFRKAVSREPVLLLVSGANRVDEDAMAAALGEKLERMDPREVRALTGFAIGGVAPLGSLTPVATYMDADLLRHDTVWAAAGAPSAVFAVAPQALADAIGARIVPVR